MAGAAAADAPPDAIAAPGAGTALGGAPDFTAPDGESTGVAARDACNGALWQPASNATAHALTNRFDLGFTDFHLAVAAWIELRQRGKALLHPLIVNALLGPRRVDFMQFDGLLLERKCLLLE